VDEELKSTQLLKYNEIMSDKKKLKIVMRKMKYFYQSIIFQVTQHDIPICCQLFFHSWNNFRKDIPEYAETMSLLTNNEGIILCPDCIIQKLQHSTFEVKQ